MKGSGDAVQFVREAFKHAKPIAAIGDGADFLNGAGQITIGGALPLGVRTGSDAATLAPAFTSDVAMHRLWDRPVKGVAA